MLPLRAVRSAYYFPASGESRVYSWAEAPVTRVSFNPGDVIKSVEEWELEVESIEVQGELLCYHGTRVDNGEAAKLKETFLDHFIKFNKPQDRLFAGQVDRFTIVTRCATKHGYINLNVNSRL